MISSSQNPLISVHDAIANFNSKKAVFIDVRDPKDFSEGHVPGAHNINEIFSYLSFSDTEGRTQLISTFEKLFSKIGITGDEHIITYEDCLKTRFGASCRGYYILKLLGHKNVNILNGGWEAWVKAGGETTNEYAAVNESSFKAVWNNDIFFSKDDILNLISINDPNVVLVDVRDVDEWKGESSSPYGKDFVPRKGRIPGAVHLIWKDFMTVNCDGVTIIKENDEIENVCREIGITKDKQVVVYCFKGARSSNTFASLIKAGFPNVKNYFASWNEWSRDNSLPIDSNQL